MSTRPMIQESYNNIVSDANLLHNNNNKSTTSSSENKTLTLKKENQKYLTKSPIKRKWSSTILSDFRMSFLKSFLDKENELEDEHLTEEYFNAIFIDEMISTVLVAISILTGILFNEIKFNFKLQEDDLDYYNKLNNITLIIISISVISFILCMIPRYTHYFYLYKAAKYISSIDNFFQSGLISNVLIEFFLAIIHPNILLKDKYVKTSKKWNLLAVKYQINDFLLAIMLFRSYYFLKFYILCTNYYGARADRICKMMGKQTNYIFSFKCILISKTIQTLIFITVLTCLMFSYMLKVIEGPVYLLGRAEYHENSYMQYLNCFWNVLVTMTTVGYGDYYPKSVLGRFVVFLVSIIGNIIVALNIDHFQSHTELNDDEKRVLDLIKRFEEKDEIKNLAVSYFKNNFEYVITKRKYFRGEIPNDKNQKKNMIKRARDKFLYRKKYKDVVHRFQIKYKMATDVDQVKKKIRFIDDTVYALDEKLKKFSNRFKQFYLQ
jgi:potassium intermediate/small conductance calcium-activated channel subfamily N protein 2